MSLEGLIDSVQRATGRNKAAPVRDRSRDLGQWLNGVYRGMGGDAAVQAAANQVGRELWSSMGVEAPASAAPRSSSPAPSGVTADPRVHNTPMTQAQLADLRAGQDDAIRAYAVAPGLRAPDPHVAPAARARQEALTTMAQQYAPQNYWASETGQAMAKAIEAGPKAGESGYAQRADIQAWMDAQRAKGPAGAAMVDRFIEQQKKRGLWSEPTPAVDQLLTAPEDRAVAQAGYSAKGVAPLPVPGGGDLRGEVLTAQAGFENPQYGVEALRGAPVGAIAALAPNPGTADANKLGYGGGVATNAFNSAQPLAKTAFPSQGLTADARVDVDREQGVPGITEPFASPDANRTANLEGADALVDKYKLLALRAR